MKGERLPLASRLIDVFSDVDRLRLIGRLVEGSWTVSTLAADTGIKPQSIVRHLRSLEEAGLIARDNATSTAVRFDIDHLRSIAAELRPDQPDHFADRSDLDARVLRSFVVDGRLTQLPSQRSRWLVILRWLSERFEFDHKYTEREVSAILEVVHPDYALLRRQLVDEQFLARDHGVYWRTDEPEAS